MNRQSGIRLKVGIDRQGNVSFNLIDRHGFGFIALDKYERENLFALMLLDSGLLDGRLRKKAIRKLSQVKIGTISYNNRRLKGNYYIPHKYVSMAEIIQYKYQDIKQRRLSMIKRKFSLAGWVKTHNGID